MSNAILELILLIYDFVYVLVYELFDYFPIGDTLVYFGSNQYELSVLIASITSLFVIILFLMIPFIIINYIIKLLKGRVRQ